jgi:hypothetical protein
MPATWAIVAPMATPTSTSVPKLPKAGFWWALIIFVVTAIAGIVMIVLSITTIANTIGDFAEIDVPQVAEVRLAEGEYWVFAGTSGNSSANAFLVDVVITSPDGSTVTLRPEFGQYEASSGGDEFTSLGRVEIEQAGVYTFETDGPEGTSVRVGKIPVGRIVALLIGGFVVGGLGFLIALIVLIVTLVRRGRRKRELATTYGAPAPYAGGPPPYGGGTPPPPGGPTGPQPGQAPPPPGGSGPAGPAPSAPTPPPPSAPVPAAPTPPPPAPTPPPPPTPTPPPPSAPAPPPPGPGTVAPPPPPGAG